MPVGLMETLIATSLAFCLSLSCSGSSCLDRDCGEETDVLIFHSGHVPLVRCLASQVYSPTPTNDPDLRAEALAPCCWVTLAAFSRISLSCSSFLCLSSRSSCSKNLSCVRTSLTCSCRPSSCGAGGGDALKRRQGALNRRVAAVAAGDRHLEALVLQRGHVRHPLQQVLQPCLGGVRDVADHVGPQLAHAELPACHIRRGRYAR